MSGQVETLWAAYKQNGSQNLRQLLIEQYLPLVKYLVGRIHTNLPAHVDREDLITYGVFGLIDAIDKYDPQRGVKFETYASQRIKGAILDELRQASWVPRSVSDKLKNLAEVYSRLEQEYGEEVPSSVVAQAMGLTREEFDRIHRHVNWLSVMSLEEFLLGQDENLTVSRVLEDKASPDPVGQYEEKELKEALIKALEELNEKDRLLISLYYYEGLTFKEIGKVLGVSESRVSQLHARALLRLRHKMHVEKGY